MTVSFDGQCFKRGSDEGEASIVELCSVQRTSMKSVRDVPAYLVATHPPKQQLNLAQPVASAPFQPRNPFIQIQLLGLLVSIVPCWHVACQLYRREAAAPYQSGLHFRG